MIFKQADSGESNMKEIQDAVTSTMDLMTNINDPANQAKFITQYGKEAWTAFKEQGKLPGEMAEALGGYAD
jgi:hypothetical protein